MTDAPVQDRKTRRPLLLITATVVVIAIGGVIAFAVADKDDPPPALTESASLARAHDLIDSDVARLRRALDRWNDCHDAKA